MSTTVRVTIYIAVLEEAFQISQSEVIKLVHDSTYVSSGLARAVKSMNVKNKWDGSNMCSGSANLVQMLIQKTFVDVPVTYGTNRNRIFVISPKLDGYPSAKFPGVVVFSEIYQVTGPVERLVISMLSADGDGLDVAFLEVRRPNSISGLCSRSVRH